MANVLQKQPSAGLHKLLPTYFIPHGGGPCFFMDWDPADTWDTMRDFLAGIIPSLSEKPKAILVISGHWETSGFMVAKNPHPNLIFDYHGFPKHTYELTWPAQGDAHLTKRVHDLCKDAGISVREDNERGFDHGVFVPLKVAIPNADIPTVVLSIRADYDPTAHIALGKALQPLREEGVLIIGSGMSFHNLRAFQFHSNNPIPRADAFTNWLDAAVTDNDVQRRNKGLVNWASAPEARFAHPSEDHLIPLMVVAGAAGDDVGVLAFHDRVMGVLISAYRFG